MNLFNEKKGAVTIFLAIVLSVCLILAEVLVEAARVRNASIQIKSSADLAGFSVLSDYNQILKEFFGLMALSENDPEKLNDELSYYLEKTLNIDTQSNKTTNEYKNMYKYSLNNSKVEPIYNLSEPDVLNYQILEYMKYRAPKELAVGVLDKLSFFKDMSSRAKTIKKDAERLQELDSIENKKTEASNNIKIQAESIKKKETKVESNDSPDPREVSKPLYSTLFQDSSENFKIDSKVFENLPSNKIISTNNEILKNDKTYYDQLISKGLLNIYATNSVGIKANNIMPNQIFNENPDTGAMFKSITYSTKLLESFSKLAESLNGGLINLRDDLYIDEYALSKFKNASSQQNTSNAAIEGVFKSAEVEYVLSGNKDEEANKKNAKLMIFLTRFALNTIAIYSDPSKLAIATETALLLSSITGGLATPFAQTLILMAWAFSEAIIDTLELINGADVPIFKLKGQWYLEATTGEQLKDLLGNLNVNNVGDYTKVSNIPNSNNRGGLLTLNYKDYLRLLLLFTNKEAKLLRIADLIQLNMVNRYGAKVFTMGNANTYMRISGNVSYNYLFSLPFKKKISHSYEFVTYKGY